MKWFAVVSVYERVIKFTEEDIEAYNSYPLHTNFTHIFSNSAPWAEKK